jgi:hypothetical protein
VRAGDAAAEAEKTGGEKQSTIAALELEEPLAAVHLFRAISRRAALNPAPESQPGDKRVAGRTIFTYKDDSLSSHT